MASGEVDAIEQTSSSRNGAQKRASIVAIKLNLQLPFWGGPDLTKDVTKDVDRQ